MCDLKINYDDLLKLYNELKPYDAEKIKSASNVLKTSANYLWLSDYIEIGYNTLASQISDYINNNLAQTLSIQKICDAIGISKNKLYDVSNKHFNMPIGEYIANCRISESKKLLTSTYLSVREVSEKVGFLDYNYFIRLFKKHVGTTPLKYRNYFPFNLHD